MFAVIITFLFLCVIGFATYFLTVVAMIRSDFKNYHQLSTPPSYLEFVKESTSSVSSILSVFNYRGNNLIPIEQTDYPNQAARMVSRLILSDIYSTLKDDCARQNEYILITMAVLIRVAGCDAECKNRMGVTLAKYTDLPQQKWGHVVDYVLGNVYDTVAVQKAHKYSYEYLARFNKLPQWKVTLNAQDIAAIKKNLAVDVFYMLDSYLLFARPNVRFKTNHEGLPDDEEFKNLHAEETANGTW